MYDKKDAQRLKLIKENGYMTLDEYTDGIGSTGQANEEGQGDEQPEPPTPIELDVDLKERLDRANHELSESRNALIEIMAQRSRKAFNLRRSTNKNALEKAQQEYQLAVSLAGQVFKEVYGESMSPEELNMSAIAGAGQESLALAQGMVQRTGELANSNKLMRKFNDWWTRQSAVAEDGTRAKLGKTKKVAAIVAITALTIVPASAVVATAGAIGAGIAVPVGLMTRFARGQAVSRISRNANALTQMQVHADAVHVANLEKFSKGAPVTSAEIVEDIRAMTDQYVRQNKKRLGKTAIVGAGVGSALSFLPDIFSDVEGPSLPWGGGSGDEVPVGGGSGDTEIPVGGGVLAPDDIVDPSEIPAEVPSEALETVNEVIESRTNELMEVSGNTPWDRAADVYGAQEAGNRLIGAVERLQAEGINAEWVGNPLTDRGAYISIDGMTNTDSVWQSIVPALANEELRIFFEAANQLPTTS
jgi:hypothetical protein